MKEKVFRIKMLCFCLVGILLSGCQNNNFDKQIAGNIWYREGEDKPSFELFDDGTCVIKDEYGSGTWSIVDNDTLKLTDYYGQAEIATIVSIEGNKMVLKSGKDEVVFYTEEYYKENFDNSDAVEDNGSEAEIEDITNIEFEDGNELLEDMNNENDTMIIADSFELYITNFESDGTFWGEMTDDENNHHLIKADIFNNILYDTVYYDSIPDCDYIDENVCITYENIYNTQTLENITSQFTGGYDSCVKAFARKNGAIIICTKDIDDFSGNYTLLRILDESGNILIDLSLDAETLLNTYGIEKYYDSSDELMLNQVSDNSYIIRYVGERYGAMDNNSLLIDLEKNTIMPVLLPQDNGFVADTDGEYSLFYINQFGCDLINNSTGEQYDLHDVAPGKYYPRGSFSEGLFWAEGPTNSNVSVMMNPVGEICIDLSNYGHSVSDVLRFHNGKTAIEFADDWVAFIDNSGEMLFEPIKGSFFTGGLEDLYDESGYIAVINEENEDYSENGHNVYLINSEGKQMAGFEQVFSGEIYYVEYGGKEYFVCADRSDKGHSLRAIEIE